MIELVTALLLLAIGATDDVTTAGTALLLLLLELLLLPATPDAAAAAAAACPLDDFDAPLNLAQLNLSPQLPFLDLAPVEDELATTEPVCFVC